MSSESSTVGKHPIRVVERRTGLPAATLRAWEKRYGVVVPDRSSGGHRIYSDVDILRLRLLREAVEGGRNIGRVARLSTAELKELVREDQRAGAAVPVSAGAGVEMAEVHVERGLEAIQEYDLQALEDLLTRGAMMLRSHELLDGVIVPLLREVGERWHRGEMSVGQEHAASATVQRFLGEMLRALGAAPGAPTVVTATPAGQRHEFGVMLAATAAALEGWNPVYLGPDLPSAEIVEAALRKGAAVVALSALLPVGEPDPVEEILSVRAGLPGGVRVIAGGSGLLGQEERVSSAGVIHVESLGGFRDALREARLPLA